MLALLLILIFTGGLVCALGGGVSCGCVPGVARIRALHRAREAYL